MAEFLIKAADVLHDDPALNQRAYKRGDIVLAMPDGHPWGRVERDTQHFLIVQVPDMSLDEAQSLCVPMVGMDIATGEEIMTVRRRYFCAQNIRPEHLDYFNQCVAESAPYETTRLDFLSYSVTDKVV